MSDRTSPSAGARVLLVDDEKNLQTMLSKILRRNEYEVTTAGDGAEALRLVEATIPSQDSPETEGAPPFDCVLTDLQMPRMDGLALLRAVREKLPELPVLLLTGHGSIESAVQAMKLGAADYLIKPCNPDELLIVLERAIETSRLQRENRSLKERLQRYEPSQEIIGSSAAIAHILQTVRSVARNRSNVLISGESGAGKELIARAIHDSGPFARFPFIAVNCGALSETLLESQLFGHRRGAFTGAVNDHIGFFQAAENGTLFLDEISEMSPHLQVKLLRAIQQHEVIPVGDTQAMKVNVRMICATNRDLEYEVRNASFRQDLFYRLNVVNIHVPPLRERTDDLPALINHFILLYAKEYDVAPKAVTPEAMNALLAYPWPGNIRELQNTIERSFALSDAEAIELGDLPPQLFRDPEAALAAVRPTRTMPTAQSLAYREARSPRPADTPLPLRDVAPIPPAVAPAQSAAPARFDRAFVPSVPEGPVTLDQVEKRQIEDALRRAKGKKIEAARLLGIDRKRLARKIKKYGLE